MPVCRRTALLVGLSGLLAPGLAWADCESDLVQLEQAYKTPNLSTQAKGALDEAKTVAVTALKRDDDDKCHQAIAAGLKKAGLELK